MRASEWGLAAKRNALGRFALRVGLPAVTALILVWLRFGAADVPFSDLTRDPVSVLGGPWYTGLLSHIGVMATAGAGFVACFAARTGRAGHDQMLRWLGRGLLFIALDDAILIHEAVLPIYLGIPEVIGVGVLYPVAGIAFVVSFRRTLLAEPDVGLLVLTAVCWSGAVIVDVSGLFIGLTWAEEPLELFGTLAVVTFTLSASMRTVTATIHGAAEDEALEIDDGSSRRSELIRGVG